MGKSFQSGYRELIWKAKGFDTPPDPNTTFIDPTKVYSSNESPLLQTQHGCSGTFFRYNVSPTSFDLDPYFFFAKTDFSITVKAGASKDINNKKKLQSVIYFNKTL